MLKKQLKKSDQQGFTIIEIVIVLAIAALILLIVFLALPALQRSQRNTARKSDAGHVSSAVNNFVSNNNGQLPGGTTGATWTTDCATILNDAGATNNQLNQYSANNNFVCGTTNGSANASANQFVFHTGNYTQVAITGQAMVLDVNAQCPTTTGNTTITTAASTTPRQAALLYTVEPASGSWLWNCVTSE